MRRRRLAIHINLAFFAVLLGLSSLWLRSEESAEVAEAVSRPASSPAPAKRRGERYFTGNRFNGVFLEIQGEKYTERYRTRRDSTDKIISQGRCVKQEDTLTLIDTTTEVQRVFKNYENELLHIDRLEPDFSRYRKTNQHWNDLLLRRESPYSVNGVRLGDSLAEVEARWGPLKPDKGNRHRFRSISADDQRVEIDSYGRVDSVSGFSLIKDKKTLLSTNDKFETALELGTKREYKGGCGGGGPYSIRGAERVLGDHHLEVIGYNRKVLAKKHSDEVKEMEKRGVDLDKILYFKLSFRHLSSSELGGENMVE